MKEIDKIFKDKLQSHEAVPPSALWDRLEDHLAENDKRKAAIWWRAASSAAAVGTLAIGVWWFTSQQNEVGQTNMAMLSMAKDTVVVNLPENQGNSVEPNKEMNATPTPQKRHKIQPQRLKQQFVPQVPEHLAERKNTKPTSVQPTPNATENTLAAASPDTANAWDTVATHSNTKTFVAELKTPKVAPLPTSTEIVVELKPEKVQVASAEKPQSRVGRFWQKVRGIKVGEEQEALGEKIDEQRQRLVALISK